MGSTLTAAAGAWNGLGPWLGGTRWTFVTHGRQYPVHAAETVACPGDTSAWRFWSGEEGYEDGEVFADCADALDAPRSAADDPHAAAAPESSGG